MKRLTTIIGGLALGAVVAFMPSMLKATIIGSGHDFSPSGSYTAAATNGAAIFVWGGETNTYNNPCQVCHIPHKSQAYSSAHAPLWNHKMSANTYLTYDQAGSATFNSANFVGLGSSAACLSCHDGSVAINQTQSYSKTATNSFTGTALFAPSFAIEAIGGTDLTKMHPIGVSYSACVANGDDQLQPYSSGIITKMLKGTQQTVECASCHDIHRTTGASATVSHDLIVDLNGGQLCLTCHNK